MILFQTSGSSNDIDSLEMCTLLRATIRLTSITIQPSHTLSKPPRPQNIHVHGHQNTLCKGSSHGYKGHHHGSIKGNKGLYIVDKGFKEASTNMSMGFFASSKPSSIEPRGSMDIINKTPSRTSSRHVVTTTRVT